MRRNLPYEKMYLIDEDDYMRAKNINVPPVDDEPPPSPPPSTVSSSPPTLSRHSTQLPSFGTSASSSGESSHPSRGPFERYYRAFGSIPRPFRARLDEPATPPLSTAQSSPIINVRGQYSAAAARSLPRQHKFPEFVPFAIKVKETIRPIHESTPMKPKRNLEDILQSDQLLRVAALEKLTNEEFMRSFTAEDITEDISDFPDLDDFDGWRSFLVDVHTMTRANQDVEAEQRLIEYTQRLAEYEVVANAAAEQEGLIHEEMKRQERIREQQLHELQQELEMEFAEQTKKEKERQRANTRFQLGAARPYNVDLDADTSDSMEQAALLVSVVPNPILATMTVIEQIDLTQDLLHRTPPELEEFSRSTHDTINITIENTQSTIPGMTQTYMSEDEDPIIEYARTVPPPKVLKQRSTVIESPSRVINISSESEPSPQQRRTPIPISSDSSVGDTTWERTTTVAPPPPKKKAKVPTAAAGKKKQAKTIASLPPDKRAKAERLFQSFKEEGIITGDADVTHPRQPGRIQTTDLFELMTRLLSESHTKLKTPEPAAYNWILEHLHTVQPLLAFVGERTRRDYKELYNVKKIPLKLKLSGSPVKRPPRRKPQQTPKHGKSIPLAAKAYETLFKKQ